MKVGRTMKKLTKKFEELETSQIDVVRNLEKAKARRVKKHDYFLAQVFRVIIEVVKLSSIITSIEENESGLFELDKKQAKILADVDNKICDAALALFDAEEYLDLFQSKIKGDREHAITK
jgi:hypothetical protein